MVSFKLSDDQEMIQSTIKDFAKEQLQPIAHECDENETIPENVVKKFWELALLQNVIPEEYGGFGGGRSILTGALVAEELAAGDLAIALHLLAPNLFVLPILEFGTEEQKKKYLPLFCKENFLSSTAAVMEPRINFDLTSLKSKVKQEGEEYLLSGEKCYVPLGKSSEKFLVFATTREGVGYAGVDGFIIEKGISGFKKSEKEKNMGIKALETCEINFNQCRIPKQNKLGGDNGSNFLKLMDYARITLSAMAVGVARSSYEYAKEYAKTRYAFGEPIASRQAIAFMLAENALEIDATRLLVWEAAWKMDKGKDCSKEAYLAKRYAADMTLKVCDRGVQILGGHGYIREHPVEMWLRNARGFAVFEGIAMV